MYSPHSVALGEEMEEDFCQNLSPPFSAASQPSGGAATHSLSPAEPAPFSGPTAATRLFYSRKPSAKDESILEHLVSSSVRKCCTAMRRTEVGKTGDQTRSN